MEETYNKLYKKIDELMKKQNETKPQHNNQVQEFYNRTVNLTNISFTKEDSWWWTQWCPKHVEQRRV
jgi:hypothetical protein